MPETAEFSCVIRYPDQGGVVSPPDGVQFLASSELAVSKAAYWGREVEELPTSFLDVSDRATIDLILSHLNEWDIGVRFVWSQSGGVIRITTGAGGYWSVLGRSALQVPANEPTMNLQWSGLRSSSAERRRVIPHEGFHALGGEHEHLRREIVADIDPAKAYAYYARTQGWGRAIVDANVLRPLDEASVMASPLDVDSIMGYPIVSQITRSGRSYPGGAVISPTDRAFALSVYPKPNGPVVPPSPPVEPATTAALVLAEVNARRSSAGLSPLAADIRLDAIAAGWAGTMAATGVFTHGDFAGRIASVYPGRASGEIIAAGQTSPAQAVDDWMNSPGHRAHVLGAYALAGCGSATSSATGARYWAVDFAGPGTTPPPVEPPKPKPGPPPVEPPKPKPKPEEFGPYDLRVGSESDKFTMIDGAAILFRFRVGRRRGVVAATRGQLDLTMELLDAGRRVLNRDDDSGIGGNPMLAATLQKGDYYLRIKGAHSDVTGPFRVKVAPA